MILITGATGFVGSHITRRLLQEGWQVRCLVRNPWRAPTFLRRDCELYEGDVLEEEKVEAAVQGAEAIVHLVGIIVETKQATFQDMHVRATQNLLAAAKKAGVRRFLHMSALGCGPEAITRYHLTKWEAQAAVSKSELAYTIFRPSVIFGPEDKFINLLGDMVRRLPALPRFGQGRIQPIWVEDVAACFAHALKADTTCGGAFDLCGPDVFTLDELMDLLCRKLGKHRLRLGIPPWLMRLGAALLELLSNPPVTREQMLMMGEANTCSGNNVAEVFGITPRRLEDYLNQRLAAPVA